MLANTHRARPDDAAEPSFPPPGPEALRQLTAGESELVEHAISVLRGVSRTFSGVSDTSTSPDKPKLLVEGQALAEAVEKNFRLTLGGLIARIPIELGSRADVLSLLRSVIITCNAGLAPEDRPLLRWWETGIAGHPKPADIEEELNRFSDEFLVRYAARKEDPVAVAAWIEQELNGRIHPFSDGCGRASRALAAFVLAESDIPLPCYENREEFFEKINFPFEVWSEYYRRLTATKPLREPQPL